MACPGVSKEGYMCCKPIEHSGLCHAPFTDGPGLDFKYRHMGRIPVPITITDSEIEQFGLNKQDVLAVQKKIAPFFESDFEEPIINEMRIL